MEWFDVMLVIKFVSLLQNIRDGGEEYFYWMEHRCGSACRPQV